MGRKEILDLLLTVREQTTVLFSTHILSDVERICTFVAFLDQGTAKIQGPLHEIRTRYRSEEYLVETENETGMQALQTAFPALRQTGKNQLSFRGKDCPAAEVLRFLADRDIPPLRFERAEPSLESLFMEVVEK